MEKILNTHFCFVSPSGFPLFIKGACGPGGAERQFFLIAQALQKRGARVSFITEPVALAANDEIDRRFKVITVPIFRQGDSLFQYFRNILAFCRAMHRIKADYYLIKFPSYLLLPMGLYCNLARKTLIFWAQRTFDSTPSQRNSVPMIVKLMSKLGMALSDILIAQSEEQRSAFKRNYGRYAAVVPNIYDRIEAACHGQIQEGRVDVLWVGNSMVNKRYEVVVALALLMQDVTFAVAMNMVDKKRFTEAKSKLESLPNVKFLGMVPPVEMEQWYEKCKVFLNTSAMEGFPNTFLQAWANGVPVVSLNIDPDNVILNHQLGIIVSKQPDTVESFDFDELAQRIAAPLRKLLGDEARRERMGEAATKFVKTKHGEENVLTKLTDAISI